MSLGVLNNLSAMYAENNLNNTTNSLNTVLQQLSSGSKINSGADDAAGLSLVDGLQANSMALAQSQTNAQEGVGLLQVADGALSQVTSLLNRAVTLATEASNGTLNSSQDTAANQEYQSILSEINNIGTTTTYNDTSVFGQSATNIYTGDSSTAGASIDSLNISALSSSNVGDTGGVMNYSNGSDNVFLNLSTSTANAKATDNLSGTTTSMTVNYLVQGANGASSTATDNITVGGANSSYANTAQGLISAINNSGLGLSASFTTQADAGVAGGGTQTGIEITGGLVSAGINPSATSTSGTLNLGGLAAGATLALGTQLTVSQGSNTHTFTIDSTNDTLQSLANSTASAAAWTQLGVNATVVTNGDGTQSLSLSDANSTGGALTVTTQASSTPQTPTFSSGAAGTTQNVQTQGADTLGTQAVTAQNSTVTVGTASGAESYSDQLTAGGNITIQNSNLADPTSLTFVVGAGTNNTPANTIYTGAFNPSGGDTLGNLADTINSESGNLGVYATVTTSGLQLNTGTWTGGSYATSGATTSISATNTDVTGENVSVTGSSLTSATPGATGTELSLYSPTIGSSSGGGVAEFTDFSTSDSTNGVHAELEGDTISGSTTFTGSQGSYTFTAAAGNNTWTSMVQDINSANIGISAGWNATMAGAGDGGITLTSNDSTDVMYVNPATNTIIDGGVGAALEQVSTLSVGANGSLTGDDVTAGNITLTGSGGTGAQITTNGSTTWGALATSINSQHATTGINAVYSANLNGTGDGGILMFDTAGTTNDSATMTTIGDGVNSASIVNQGVKGTGIESNVDVYDSSAVDSETDKLSGSFTVDGSHGTYTFAGNGTTTSYATLVSDINAANIGVQATWTTGINGSADAGIVLNSTDTSSVLGAEQTSGTMATADTLVEATGGNSVSHFAAVITGNNDSTVSTPSTAVLQLSNAPISDATATLGGAITIAYHGTSQTFIMGSQPTTASEQVGSAIYTNGTSVQSLVNAINSTQTGGVANNLNNGAVHMLATDPGTGTGAIFLQGVAGYNGAITMTAVNPDSGNGISSPLAVTSAMTAGTTTKGVTGVTGVNASDSITTGGAAISTSDTVAGSITVTNGGDNVGLDTAATGGLASVTNVSATGSSSVNDVLKSGTTFDFTTAAGAAFTYTAAANDTWQTLVSDINNSTTVGSGVATGVTAAWSATAGGAGNGGIVLTNNYNGATNVTVNPSTLADQTVGNVLYADTQNAGEAVSAGTASTPQVTGFSAGSGDLVGDDLLANSSATFTVDGKADTFTANSLGTSTWQSMITQINTSNIGTGDPYGVTASFNANAGGTGVAGMILTNNWSGPDTVTVAQGGIALEDTTASNTPITNTHTVAGTGTATVSVLDAGAAAASTDALTGSIAMTVGANEYTFAAGPTSNWNSLVSAINSSAIGVNDNSGVTAKWNANADGTGIGGIVLTGNEAGMNPVSVTSNSLVDQATAVTDTFTVGAGNNSPSTNQFFTEPTTGANYGNSLTGLANLISAQTNLHVSAQANASGLTLTQTIANGGSIATSGNGLTDVTAGTYNKATSTALASENDALTGSLVFTVAGNTQSVNMSTLTNQTAAGLISYISQHSSTLGVSAAWVPSTSGNPNFGQIQLTSGTQGSTGGVVVSPLTSLTDTTTGAALNYTAGTAYNTGISANVVDSNTSQTSAAQLSSQNLKGSGIATISYTDGAGQSLASTKLTNQTNAEATLNALNTAITDVASQDGYIGAQINTLNAVSSVLSTQQENVVSAQNAVQATDYASATSNMSKYEILSQTGISALAQANSMSQEVTKLLQ